MIGIEQVVNELKITESRIDEHEDKLKRQGERMSDMMDEIQTVFGGDCEGQQIVQILMQAINKCSLAGSNVYFVKNTIRDFIMKVYE